MALRKLYDVDNNAYAFMFDKEVYRHFTDYVYHQPKERLKWGYRRLMQHEKSVRSGKTAAEKRRSRRKRLSGRGSSTCKSNR